MSVLYDPKKNEVQITVTSYKMSGEKENVVVVIDSDTINSVRKLALSSLYGRFANDPKPYKSTDTLLPYDRTLIEAAIQCVKTARTLPIKQGADYELYKALELLKRALDY